MNQPGDPIFVGCIVFGSVVLRDTFRKFAGFGWSRLGIFLEGGGGGAEKELGIS